MRGFARGLEHCANIIRENSPVDARRIIKEYIAQLGSDLLKCDGGNFYIEQQIVAAQHVLKGLYSIVAATKNEE